VTILRAVEFWPQSGFVNAPWLDDPDEDAFVRSARGISELYSEGVRSARVEVRHSQLRLHCFDHEPGRVEVAVTVFTESADSYEMAGVSLPDGVAALSATARAALALDVVHAAALRLAEARGWEPAAFEAAREHVVRQGMRFRWIGPEKTAPGRRHIARPVCAIAGDGYGRVVVEIRRVTDGVLVGASAELQTGGTAADFRRVARTLRWRDSTTVQINTDDQWHTTKVEELPVLTVQSEDENPVSWIHLLGGFTDAAVPEGYTTALHVLMDELQEPQWATWWSAAQDDVLEIWYDLIAERPAGVTTRRTRDKLRVRVARPLADIIAATDPIALAVNDVTAMLVATQQRTGLGPHPKLPDLSQLTAATEEQIQRRTVIIGRMQVLLDRLADRLPAWLVASLRGDLRQGKAGEVASVLRVQLAHLGIETTEAERAELDALAATQR
jgi:hypothetical protein